VIERKFLDRNQASEAIEYMDGFGKVIQKRVLAESGYSVLSMKYNQRGEVVEKTFPVFEAGFGYSGFFESAAKTVFEYDGLGRAISVTTPAGRTLYSYGTWSVAETDAKGPKFHFEVHHL
jgi:hypothetical protein